jgi:hypothetical protein
VHKLVRYSANLHFENVPFRAKPNSPPDWQQKLVVRSGPIVRRIWALRLEVCLPLIPG